MLPWDHNAYYDRLLLETVPRGAARVLEVGCGAGRLARQIAARAKQVDAIDRDAAVIALARSTAPDNVKYVLGDVMDYPLATESYDAVVSMAELHHLPLRPALQRFAIALRPGGGARCDLPSAPRATSGVARGACRKRVASPARAAANAVRVSPPPRAPARCASRADAGQRPAAEHPPGPRTGFDGASRRERPPTVALAVLAGLAQALTASSIPDADHAAGRSQAPLNRSMYRRCHGVSTARAS